MKPHDYAPCRFGYEEHDGYRYCFEHGGWHHYAIDRDTRRCDRWNNPGDGTGSWHVEDDA